MTGRRVKIDRRTLIGGTAALIASPAITARAATKELTVATWGGLYEQYLRKNIIPDFEKANDATVKLELGVGTTFIPKIIASPRRAPYDVLYLNDDEAYLGESANLWAPDQSAKLAGIKDIYEFMKPPAAPFYGSVVYDFPLVYNTKKMEKPTSWNDLWKGDITIGVPHISNSYGITFLLIAALLNGGDAKNLAPGFDAIKRLPKFKIFKGVTQGFTMFQQDEIDAALFYGHRARQLKEQGLPLDWASPKEGVWGMRAGCQIPRSAANMDLSRAWIEATLSVPYQQKFADALYSPSNKTVELSADLAAKNLYGSEQISKLRYPDWSIINPQRDQLLTRFTKDFAS